MVSPKYTELKDFVSQKVGMSDIHNHLLKKLKVLYQNDINSTRGFEQIRTIGQLLKSLEKRDLLGEYNILPLEVIATRLPNHPDLIRRVEEYKTTYMPKQRSNRNDWAVEQATTGAVKTEKCSSFIDGISDKKRERIFKTIIEEIGSYWQNLARYLNVKEYKIDEIELKYKTPSEKATEIIGTYYERADRQIWFFELISALEKVHRRDLSDEVKKISTMNM